MKKQFKKAMSLVIVCVLSCTTGFIMKAKQANEAQAWAGIAYCAARRGASAEAGFVIGICGAFQSSLHGFAWGAAFGGPAGAIAGGVVGL
ncbi:hypothetical protein HMPREF9135_1155 [Segatella baroniae F0067]|uniref:Lipoprotein n=1 Tax=Segatella baroniae F0067 TaxID=1115809 RepID=U2QJV5_9BACT|nr:hypothetical protein [Segatella baroniae]ERK39097.1 hypothetical protein HMPREF9135_1155 [Segatella baroniae F0067]